MKALHKKSIFTADWLAKAYKISNDISEGIDCGESRGTLRKCIKALMDEMQRRHEKRRHTEIAQLIQEVKKLQP